MNLNKVVDGSINIDEYFNKTKLNIKKSMMIISDENSYWMNVLVDYFHANENNHTIT